MPKKIKNHKNKKYRPPTEDKLLIYADLDYQTYGIVEKELGNCFFNINCVDGMTRRCKLRKGQKRKLRKIQKDDVLIISLREFDIKTGDIIHRFDPSEVKRLIKEGELPRTEDFENSSNRKIDDDINDDDLGFDFDDI